MPQTWKKLVVSGSEAQFNSVFVTTSITASSVSSSFTGSFSGDGAGLTGIGTSLSIDTYKFVGNGSTTNYILSSSYSAVSLLISVAGISYTEGLDYTLSGSTLAFVTAPPSSSNILIKGLLNNSNATGSFTGSFIGTASAAISASYAPAPAGTVSGSAQITTLLPASIVSSSTQFQTLANPFTGSFTGSHTGTFPYASLTSIPGGIVSASAQINALSGISASYATTASAATSITFTPTTASFATTASYANNYAVGKAIAFSLIF